MCAAPSQSKAVEADIMAGNSADHSPGCQSVRAARAGDGAERIGCRFLPGRRGRRSPDQYP
jgi:hypothetical protein